MPSWMVVFVLIWSTLIFFGAVLMGAYVGYCKEQKLNPVSHLNLGFLEEARERRRQDDEVKGFYE